MAIQSLPKGAATGDLLSALRRDGAVIVENWVSEQLADRVASELRPRFEAVGHCQYSDFNGYKTLRINSILAHSRAAADLVEHAQLLEVADEILLENSLSYRLGSLTGIEILPGESAQALHRDDHIYPLRLPGFELQIGVMWALDDFSAENGGTRVVPGSHHWLEPRSALPEEIVEVAMPKGSALVYLGSTLHGGGANGTDQPRMGLINTYALGWLRQEENLYTKIPRERAKSFSKRVQELIGYQKHGQKLGWFGPF
ncbi:MAG: phytanoyl-CoA dioxygenase family protein [Pseudomonadota bacterium]